MVRRRLRVRGVVQGVGFRPFVYQLAVRFGLTGFVFNDTAGVVVVVQGDARRVEAFREELSAHPPPLARLDTVVADDLSPVSETQFVILPSEAPAGDRTAMPADTAACLDCLAELFEPSNRRYRYPFINCTRCGPRFSIIRHLPYDRPATTMRRFAMCVDCARDYHDPANRRFHAQPVACPACGPHVWLEAGGVRISERDQAIRQTRQWLADGGILAIKGIGGFHLACDASNGTAVATLRARKRRAGKPFAVMVRDIASAGRIVELRDGDAELLSGPARPIVMLRRRRDQRDLCDGVAPGLGTVGLMLPDSPLQHLLVDRPLVMTSGNLADEPIVSGNGDARRRLGAIADAFLMHDRAIRAACDDSVVRVLARREYPIRRSRGYAPLPVKLPRVGKAVLAVGGELKGVLGTAVEDRAFLSQHLGNMDRPESLDSLDRTARRFLDLFGVSPEIVACDLHPGYLSTRWAERFAEHCGAAVVRVPHHHAHVASLLADTNPGDRPILSACFDGTGYGTDGAIWGGEFFLKDGSDFQRVAHLKYVPLPGGDAAVRTPYRTALAHLWAAGLDWDIDLPSVRVCPPAEQRILRQMLDRGVNCVPTSSMGRLFDAVASLVGIRHVVSYEGQAAMELEAITGDAAEPYPFELAGHEPVIIDPGPLLAGVVTDLQDRVQPSVIAARFHAAIAAMVRAIARIHPVTIVGCTGGVFQNVTLLELVSTSLQACGHQVLQHRQVPCNDGGLALGQLAIGGEFR